MKRLKIENGEIRNGYEFKDLDEETQDKVLSEAIEFEIQVVGQHLQEEWPFMYLAEKMEQNRTPWFLAAEIYNHHKEDLIESIEVNNYLFDEEGNLLPLVYHMEGSECKKITWKEKYSVDIIS